MGVDFWQRRDFTALAMLGGVEDLSEGGDGGGEGTGIRLPKPIEKLRGSESLDAGVFKVVVVRPDRGARV